MSAPRGPQLDLVAAEALLARLELLVRNRLDGLLQGNYVGLVPGPGSEAGESRPYVPGDDVRRMDWPVTARTTVPHLRQTIADRELESWLVVDCSPSMDFGTARSDKRELVLAAATALVHLSARGGNRIGALVSNGERTLRVPALGGRAHARHLLRRIATMPRNDTPRNDTPRNDTPRGDGVGAGAGAELAGMLESLRRPQRRRGLVAVVSDFIEADVPGAPDAPAPAWGRPLRALSAHHQLLGIEIVDPRELELPATGLVTFTDVETGRQVEAQTSDAALRQRYAQAASQQRQRIATGLRQAGAAHLQLRTDRDWLTDVVRFVLAQRRSSGQARAVRAGR